MNTEQERAFDTWQRAHYPRKYPAERDAFEAGWEAALQSQEREDAEWLYKLMQLADRYAISVRDNWQPRKHRRALIDHVRRVEEEGE